MTLSSRAPRRRRLVGATALLAATFIPAQAASAQYGPTEEPTIEVQILQPICDSDTPYLQYAVTTSDGAGDTATITWHHPTDSSQDYVQADLPLSGSVLWPGAAVDSAGNPTDWPGWRPEGGAWVEGDEWDWVRPGVQVTIEVNPEATMTVAYPPSSPTCLTDPPGETSRVVTTDTGPVNALPPDVSGGDGLPETGAGVGWLVGIAAALVALGAGTFAFVRRRPARR